MPSPATGFSDTGALGACDAGHSVVMMDSLLLQVYSSLCKTALDWDKRMDDVLKNDPN